MSSRAKSVSATVHICSRTGFERALDAGSDIVTRAKWNAARWLDAAGSRLDLIGLLKKAWAKGLSTEPIWIKGSAKESDCLASGQIRKPKQRRDIT